MNKTLWMTMAAFAIVGLASAAVPTAAACASTNYVVDTVCNPSQLPSDPSDLVEKLIDETEAAARNAVRDLLSP